MILSKAEVLVKLRWLNPWKKICSLITKKVFSKDKDKAIKTLHAKNINTGLVCDELTVWQIVAERRLYTWGEPQPSLLGYF